MLYPLKFEPILKETIWGGDYLNKELAKGDDSEKKVGESLEVSSLDGSVSMVSNGFLKGNSLLDIIEVYMGDLIGEKVYEKFGIELPILIKIIDAKADLSIQVHPDEKLANEKYGAHGKTEMWYVLDSSEDAKIIAGYHKPTTRNEVRKCIDNNTVESLVRKDDVKSGDVFFIPAGRVHSLGAGNVVFEIQKTSDVTLRMYDYDRRDTAGSLRDLHVEESLDAMSYGAEDEYKTTYVEVVNQPSNLIKCPDFTTNIFPFDQKVGRDYYFLDSFVLLFCTEGSFTVDFAEGDTVKVKKGESLLLPAQVREYFFTPQTEKATFIETYLEIE